MCYTKTNSAYHLKPSNCCTAGLHFAAGITLPTHLNTTVHNSCTSIALTLNHEHQVTIWNKTLRPSVVKSSSHVASSPTHLRQFVSDDVKFKKHMSCFMDPVSCKPSFWIMIKPHVLRILRMVYIFNGHGCCDHQHAICPWCYLHSIAVLAGNCSSCIFIVHHLQQ